MKKFQIFVITIAALGFLLMGCATPQKPQFTPQAFDLMKYQMKAPRPSAPKACAQRGIARIPRPMAKNANRA